ncbi:hypothetical protein D3C72_2595520 [compost metagenome]
MAAEFRTKSNCLSAGLSVTERLKLPGAALRVGPTHAAVAMHSTTTARVLPIGA